MCTRAEGGDALLVQMHAETDAAVTLKKPRPNPSEWVAVTALFSPPFFNERGSGENIGVSSRLGAGARSSSSVPRAAVSVLDERGRSALSKK